MTDSDNLLARATKFLLWCGGVLIVFSVPLWRLVRYSLERGYSSHIVLIPVLTTYLIWSHRKRIFASPKYSISLGFWVSGLAFAIVLTRLIFGTRIGSEISSLLNVVSVLLFVLGGFVAAFGATALRKAAFPFGLLVLVLPIPGAAVDKIIWFLQSASASLSAWIFSALGVPVFREGFVLTVPGVSIEVATECSGINSSIALLIIMLLLAHEALHTTWRRAVLILITIPLSIVKNAIRIVTLTLLATRVDPGFLTGRLHHEGGFVFFLIALALVYPVLVILQKTEKSSIQPKPIESSKVAVT